MCALRVDVDGLESLPIISSYYADDSRQVCVAATKMFHELVARLCSYCDVPSSPPTVDQMPMFIFAMAELLKDDCGGEENPFGKYVRKQSCDQLAEIFKRGSDFSPAMAGVLLCFVCRTVSLMKVAFFRAVVRKPPYGVFDALAELVTCVSQDERQEVVCTVLCEDMAARMSRGDPEGLDAALATQLRLGQSLGHLLRATVRELLIVVLDSEQVAAFKEPAEILMEVAVRLLDSLSSTARVTAHTSQWLEWALIDIVLRIASVLPHEFAKQASAKLVNQRLLERLYECRADGANDLRVVVMTFAVKWLTPKDCVNFNLGRKAMCDSECTRRHSCCSCKGSHAFVDCSNAKPIAYAALAMLRLAVVDFAHESAHFQHRALELLRVLVSRWTAAECKEASLLDLWRAAASKLFLATEGTTRPCGDILLAEFGRVTEELMEKVPEAGDLLVMLLKPGSLFVKIAPQHMALQLVIRVVGTGSLRDEKAMKEFLLYWTAVKEVQERALARVVPMKVDGDHSGRELWTVQGPEPVVVLLTGDNRATLSMCDRLISDLIYQRGVALEKLLGVAFGAFPNPAEKARLFSQVAELEGKLAQQYQRRARALLSMTTRDDDIVSLGRVVDTGRAVLGSAEIAPQERPAAALPAKQTHVKPNAGDQGAMHTGTAKDAIGGGEEPSATRTQVAPSLPKATPGPLRRHENCARCKKNLAKSPNVQFLDSGPEQWHYECFKCVNCRKDLVGPISRSSVFKEGRLLCSKCSGFA